MFKNIFLLRLLVLALCCTVIVVQSCKHDDSDTYKMVKDGNLRSFAERELPGLRNQLAEAQNL